MLAPKLSNFEISVKDFSLNYGILLPFGIRLLLTVKSIA